MRIAMFDARTYDREAFEAENAGFGHEITYLEPRLTRETASLAAGFPVVCAFVNDRLDAPALRTLADGGVRLVALRSAGYNHVDLAAAGSLGLPVDGKTVGIVGTGKIGQATARVFRGFGCRVLAYDVRPDAALERETGARYVELPGLYRLADVVSLHVPLTPDTFHMVDAAALASMKRGVFLVNTGRGALIDSRALLGALKSGQIGAAGLDVYEEEERIFFEDLSDRVLQDDVLARLLTFPNVLVTAHQAFLTREALGNIARTTLSSVSDFERGLPLAHALRVEAVIKPSG